MSYAYALRRLYKAAKPAAPSRDVTLWTMIWVSFAVGALLGFMTSEFKMNVTERLTGHVNGQVGCTTIPGDVCR